MTSGNELLRGTMSESMALQQPGYLLLSIALLTTEGHVGDWVWQTPESMLVPKGHVVTWNHSVVQAQATT